MNKKRTDSVADISAYHKIKSKKGLSAVVTTLLIILLSIAAIVIVWVVVRSLIGDASKGISFESFSLDLTIERAYLTGSDVTVNVRRNVGPGNLTGVYFIFHNGTASTGVKKSIPLQELESKSFTFNSTEVGNINDLELVSVSPIYSTGGDEIVGGITDTSEIRAGPPGAGGGDGENGGGDTGGTGFVCGNNLCEENEAVVCPQDCQAPPSCNGVWTPGAEAPSSECDGGNRCDSLCACQTGYVGDGSGGCVPLPSISSGIVSSVWPPGAVKYFDSADLPKDAVEIISFIGKYANFSGGNETRCLQISYAEYLDDPAYDSSYIRLELPSAVQTGNNYEVWISSTCGQP